MDAWQKKVLQHPHFKDGEVRGRIETEWQEALAAKISQPGYTRQPVDETILPAIQPRDVLVNPSGRILIVMSVETRKSGLIFFLRDSQYNFDMTQAAKLASGYDRIIPEPRGELRAQEAQKEPAEGKAPQPAAVPRQQQAPRNELRPAAQEQDLLPLFLPGTDVAQVVGEKLRQHSGIKQIEEELSAKAGLERDKAQELVAAFLAEVNQAMTVTPTLDELVEKVFEGRFTNRLEALLREKRDEMAKTSPARALDASAARALSAQIVPQLVERLRGVISSGLMAGEVLAGGRPGISLTAATPEVRFLLNARDPAFYNAAYQELRRKNPSLPAGNLVSETFGANEAWYLSADYLKAGTAAEEALVKRDLQEQFDARGVPLTIGYTIGTPQEKIAIQLAKILSKALAVGRRFGETMQSRKLGYDLKTAENPRLLMTMDEHLQLSTRDNLEKAKAMVGSEGYISAETLSRKEYLMLAELVFNSAYLYKQLKEKDGYAFGVMDEEVFNGFMAFLRDLGNTEIARERVKAAA
jgi:hypothetical protein